MKPVVCIAGPTASGKSAWAISLAKKYNGEIINADALQVYRDLRIVTARPSLEDMADIPHHLFGHVDGAMRYSTGDWVREAVDIIITVLARGRCPILVGGTGLYFKALTDGLAQIPKPSEIGWARANEILNVQGIAALRTEAERLDPIACAKVLGHDPQRLLRIVSVALGTSAPLSQWQMQTRPVIPAGFWHGAVLKPEREKLYQRINTRFDKMIAQGAPDEVLRLRHRNLSPELAVMKAIGVPQLMASQAGHMTDVQAIELAKRESRRFAKRQFTWARGQMQTWYSIQKAPDYTKFDVMLGRYV